jgi:hypothetical protein
LDLLTYWKIFTSPGCPDELGITFELLTQIDRRVYPRELDEVVYKMGLVKITQWYATSVHTTFFREWICAST